MICFLSLLQMNGTECRRRLSQNGWTNTW